MKVIITQAQLEAIKRITDVVSSMIGGAVTEHDEQMEKDVQQVDRFLEANDEQRTYK